MNKNIKKIIIFAIVGNVFSALMPSTLNIGSQCAYAYFDDDITSLKVTSGFSGIPLYNSISCKNEYRIKTGDKIPIVIYSKITGDKTNIKLDTIESKSADIRVFLGKENLKLADIYSNINIAEGEKKLIYVRLYNSKNASDSEYTAEYELIVEREVSNDDENETDDDTILLKKYDDIYLTQLALFNNDKKFEFNFDKTQSIYNINVDKDISYISIKAVPEQESYKLIINNKDVDTKGSNKNIRDVFLDEGKNIIKIRIISSEHERREYYLIITKGSSMSATVNTTTSSTENKNTGNIQQIGGSWQYKKADGTLATGWTCIENEWYYFDSTGTMKTGWFQDTSGKWYYLKESGTMAKDTIVNGYKIGSDGVYTTK